MSLRSIILAAAALCSYTNAHIIMESPVPFSVDKIDNSPLMGKAQFPCKANLGFTVSTMNNMAVGSQQTIKFKGTAVHGGGSCQLSVTTDTEPTENSKFKVIKSIEGGCPGVDGSTNEYQFELPDSIPNGKATFAWTWFSKMSGAPELYMNCAPIEVTGGASDTTAFDALPDMFVANIGEGCTSPQNFATEFPDPGSNVQMGGTNDLKTPTGSCGAAGTPADPSAPAGSGAPASSAASAAPSSAAGNNGQYTPPAGAAPTSAAVVPTSAAAAPTSAAVAPSSAAVAPTSAAAAPTSAAGSAPGYSAAPPAATPSAAPSGTAGGIFAPGASSAPVAASTQTTLVTVTGTPSTPSKTPVASAPSASKPAASAPSATKPVASAPAAGTGTAPAPTTAPSAGGSGTCTTDGAVVCNGPSQFGLCNGGKVVWQAVAAGTTCTNGTIAKRGYNGRIVRRNRSFIGHVHKH